MKRILATLLALLCAVLPLAACAELQAEATRIYTTGIDLRFRELFPLINCFVTSDMKTGGYVLRDVNGQSIDTESVLGYISQDYEPGNVIAFFANESTNGQGIMNAQGEVISVRNYADVVFLSDRWTAGIVLEKADAEPYDYTGYKRIVCADLYYKDWFVATLTRKEYKNHTIYGDYIYIQSPASILDRAGHKTNYDTSEVLWNYSEYDVIYEGNNKETYRHRGSGQQAFVPGCTLTADMVEAAVLYDGYGKFFDLQGNLLFSTDLLKNTSRAALEVYAGNYVIIYSWGDKIYYMFDLQGNVIVKSTSTIPEYHPMALGYQLYVDDGFFRYVDANGQQTAEFTLRDTNAVPTACELYNLPFLFYQNTETGMYTIISAAAGKLDESYDEVVAYSGCAPLLGVKKDGKVGVIDLYGNTVIDFNYTSMKMSNDGRLVAMCRGDFYAYNVYRIDYTETVDEANAPEAETVAEEQAVATSWHCDACDRDNDMNFCPICGTSRPVPLPVCGSCGYEAPDASYRFCPSCGSAF